MGPLRAIGAFSVILTVASERSLRATTSDSFAKAKPVPVPNLRIQSLSVILTVASERSLRGRTSDSFAKRSRYRFRVSASKKPSAFLADSGGENRPLDAGVTPAEAGTGS